MNAKASNTRNERCARALLESSGYSVVRADGALGVFDLIAFGRKGVVFVQVKTNCGPGVIERARLERFDNLPAGASKQVWLFRDRCTDPSIEVIP
jgi:Holliday junction resolvase-like predicted endonuclease